MAELFIDTTSTFTTTEGVGKVIEVRRSWTLKEWNPPDGAGNYTADREVMHGLIVDELSIAGYDLGHEFRFGNDQYDVAVLLDREIVIHDFNLARGSFIYRHIPRVFTSDTGLQQIESPFNRDEEPVIVKHPDTKTEYHAEISARAPRLAVRYQYQRKLDTRTSPLREVQGALGHVNSAIWGGGGQPGTWLVTSLDYEYLGPASSALQAWYKFEAEFEYEPLNHQPDVWYIDPESGKIPKGASEQNGAIVRNVPWYPELDFTAFGFIEP